MKSIIQEASSVFKAIEQGWVRAGQPAEFTVKILEEGQKNFFGLTTKSAKVSIFFNEKTTPEQRETSSHRQQQRPSSQREHRPARAQNQQHQGSEQQEPRRPKGQQPQRQQRTPAHQQQRHQPAQQPQQPRAPINIRPLEIKPQQKTTGPKSDQQESNLGSDESSE